MTRTGSSSHLCSFCDGNVVAGVIVGFETGVTLMDDEFAVGVVALEGDEVATKGMGIGDLEVA